MWFIRIVEKCPLSFEVMVCIFSAYSFMSFKSHDTSISDNQNHVLSCSWKFIQAASDISNVAANGVIFEIQNMNASEETIEIISGKFLSVLDNQFKLNPLSANKEDGNCYSRLYIHHTGESIILKFGPLGHALYEQSEYRVSISREETATTSGIHNVNVKINVAHTMLIGSDDQNVNAIASPKYYDAYEPFIKKVINNAIDQTPGVINNCKVIKHPL